MRLGGTCSLKQKLMSNIVFKIYVKMLMKSYCVDHCRVLDIIYDVHTIVPRKRYLVANVEALRPAMKAGRHEVADRLVGSPLDCLSVAEKREHLVGWRSALPDSVAPSLQ